MLGLETGWLEAGDPVADEVTRALAAEGNAWAASALLRTVRRNGDELPPELPEVVREFLQNESQLPDWAEPQRLARAAEWADRHLPYLSVSLLAASMPLLFAGAKGALLLRATGRLEDDVDRRVNETGRYVLEVVRPGGFEPEGSAIAATLKVRLIHAAVRHHLQDKVTREGEIPISQQEMVATLLGFSVVALRSLERLGVRISAQQAEDYFHLWRVIGALSGIHNELLPDNVVDARRLLDAYLVQVVEVNEDSQVLTSVLIDGMERHMPRIMRDVPRRLVRYLIGDRIADLLAVPEASETSARFLRATGWLTRYAPDLVATVGPQVARILHSMIVRHKLGGASAAFESRAASPLS